MAFAIQVKMKVPAADNTGWTYEWRDIHPTNGPAYRFADEQEAEKMLRMCQGDEPGYHRVVNLGDAA